VTGQAPASSQTWEGDISLTLTQGPRGTRLTESRHKGPLYVQKPFYPEGKDLAHLYLLHPPGGMVSGDTLKIQVRLNTSAQGLITTPGAGRVYRARSNGRWQKQRVDIRVGPHCTAEWLPMETIVFPNAKADLATEIHLAEGAKVIAWDVVCIGLPAQGESFHHGHLNQSLKIFQQQRLQLLEKLLIDPEAPTSVVNAQSGLQGLPVSGYMVAGPFQVGSDNTGMLDTTLAELRALRWQESELNFPFAVTLVNGFVVIRCLADCANRVRTLLEACWSILRPLLIQRSACAPRIWST